MKFGIIRSSGKRTIFYSLLIFALFISTAYIGTGTNAGGFGPRSGKRSSAIQQKEKSLQTILHNSPAGRVRSYLMDEERALLATNQGLFSYDGRDWQQLIKDETFAVA